MHECAPVTHQYMHNHNPYYLNARVCSCDPGILTLILTVFITLTLTLIEPCAEESCQGGSQEGFTITLNSNTDIIVRLGLASQATSQNRYPSTNPNPNGNADS